MDVENESRTCDDGFPWNFGDEPSPRREHLPDIRDNKEPDLKINKGGYVGQKKSWCKSSEVRLNLMCLRNSSKVRVSRTCCEGEWYRIEQRSVLIL
jgi:hypothetical protein